MTVIDCDHDFSQEIDCTYKDERYSVRDNGAIFKHSRVDKRPRPTDNKWTFGKPNKKTGYMEVATVRVHRIVATAFHGEPPTKEHVVDHIDTNRQNNRSDNLRWVTRFENAILNPITSKRIAFICGSVEEFLANPSKYRDKFPEPNYNWMCTVGSREAQISLDRMLEWANNNDLPSDGSLGEWIFDRKTMLNKVDRPIPETPDYIPSLTLNAAQRNWGIPSEFPCCPQEYRGEPIVAYADKLKAGSVFCRNDVYSSLVLKSVISDDQQLIYILSESTDGKNAIKPWALAKITYENGLFIHTSIQSFFSINGAEKQFCLEQGLEWTGEDSIDDYC